MTGAHQKGSVLGVGVTNGSPEGPAPAIAPVIGGAAVSSRGAVAAGNEPSSSNASALEDLLDLGGLLAACWRSFANSSSLAQQGRFIKAAIGMRPVPWGSSTLQNSSASSTVKGGKPAVVSSSMSFLRSSSCSWSSNFLDVPWAKQCLLTTVNASSSCDSRMLPLLMRDAPYSRNSTHSMVPF